MVALGVVALISSCKKDDGGGGSTGNGGPQISSTDFINHHTPNTKQNGYRLDSGIIKTPEASANLVLDYSTVIKSADWSDSLKPPANTTDFPSATYMRGVNQQVLGQSLTLNQYYQVSSSSWTNLGNYLGTPATVPLPTIGTIEVPAQAAKQLPALILASFPIVYNDSLSQTSTNVITTKATGTVTIPPTPPLTSPTTINLNNEPLNITQTTTVKSKNIGWGTLQLKEYTGTMQVVVQRYTTSVKTDVSFPNSPLYNAFINMFLSSANLGITNGQVIALTTYRFWVPGKGLIMTLNADGSATVTTGL